MKRFFDDKKNTFAKSSKEVFVSCCLAIENVCRKQKSAVCLSSDCLANTGV